MEPSEETLVVRARAGDETAFQQLMERRLPLLKARVKSKLPALLRRKVSESDVVQAAYVTAWQKLADFENRGAGSFNAWLDRIVEFKVQGLLRRYQATAKRGLAREVTHGQRPETNQAMGREPTPSEVAIAGELENKVKAALGDLPEHYREVLRLVQDEGLPLAEVGRRMDRSAKAVAKLYGRALCRLTELVLGEDAGT